MISEVGGGGGSLLDVISFDDGCVPGGAVVGGEVQSGGVCSHCLIGLFLRLGGDTVI